MVSLAQVAVVSLSSANTTPQIFLTALESPSPTVIMSAAKALLRRNPDAYAKQLEAVRQRLTGRFRDQLDLY